MGNEPTLTERRYKTNPSPVAAVCDRRWEANPTLTERRYKTNPSPVAAVCDRRWVANPTLKNHGPIRNHGPTEPVPPTKNHGGMGSARPKNPRGARAVAAVCDRRWGSDSTLKNHGPTEPVPPTQKSWTPGAGKYCEILPVALSRGIS
jgi:hypothetical protein